MYALHSYTLYIILYYMDQESAKNIYTNLICLKCFYYYYEEMFFLIFYYNSNKVVQVIKRSIR